MKLFVVGFGQAGGKIADLFTEYDLRTKQNSIVRSIAINTAKSDLMGLCTIPMEDRLLIGQALSKGHGVGANNEMGAKVAAEDLYTIQSAVDKRGTHETDAFLVIAGLGGGTGSGGAPVLARRLKELYAEPVYGLGILPANDEGSLYTLNAARSFMTFVNEVDNLFLFDNDAWKKEGETLSEAYKFMNEEIVRRFGVMLGAGESIKTTDDVGDLVLDASEIMNTLGSGGIATIGYAVEELVANKGFFNQVKNVVFKRNRGSIDRLDTTTRITSLVRRAAMGRLTVPCDVKTAEKALVLVAGPPEELNRMGIEKARVWVEQLIEGTEVRGGDYPIPGSRYVAGTVLFSGISDIPRIKELQQAAVEAQEKIKDFSTKKEEKFEDLMKADDSLKPLF
ncbi:MAG: tubulin/FtsZ family protein [Halobacteriota archaeon]|nr:tubulin/FtsZ family protein [Halobacteriota archaeon]